MDFKLNTRYVCPAGSTPAWFYETLAEVRRVRVGRVLMRLEMVGGNADDYYLDGVDDGTDHHPFGCVLLEPDVAVPCEDIEAFTLLGDRPIDTRDELRGGSRP